MIRDAIRGGHTNEAALVAAIPSRTPYDIRRSLGRQIATHVIRDTKGALSLSPMAKTEDAYIAQAQARRGNRAHESRVGDEAVLVVASRVDDAIRAWR